MTTNHSLRDLRGRDDKPFSSLDVPKYAPYRDGKGQLDVGMKPIDLTYDDGPEDVIFDIDKFWPYYMNKKHWLFDNCRDMVYQDINKKKVVKTHRELASWNYISIVDIEHRFGRGVKNPNWKDWMRIQKCLSSDAYFEEIERKETPDTITHKYRNFFGGPFFDIWRLNGNKYGLEELARIVQEDLCILRRRDDGWNLRAAAVCFPSYWSLKEKMGKPLNIIHGPVPQLTPDINEVITAKLDALETNKPVERFNWTLTDDMELHQPSHVRKSSIETDLHKIFVRVERQTMTRLRTGDILFTIRTYLNSLGMILQGRELSTGLHDSILNTSPEVLKYRGIDRFGDAILNRINYVYGATFDESD
jgi:hypothetical protein